MKTPVRIPVPLPPEEELQKAFKVVDDYFLHFYQLLYFHNPSLTQPGNGRPFHLTISPIYRHCIEVQTFNGGIHQQHFNFMITQSSIDREVIAKCEAILDAIKANKSKLNSYACCPLAEMIPCICMYAFRCPIHGDRHVGTHD